MEIQHLIKLFLLLFLCFNEAVTNDFYLYYFIQKYFRFYQIICKEEQTKFKRFSSLHWESKKCKHLISNYLLENRV